LLFISFSFFFFLLVVGLFGGSGGGLFGGDPFEGFDDVFQKQKPGPFQRNKQEASPPHYSYNPSIHSRGTVL
jgi:hypothetical protein